MKEAFEKWITGASQPEGWISMFVMLADHSVLARHREAHLPEERLKGVLQDICDTVQLLKLHRFKAQTVSYLFERARIVGYVRGDGVSFGMICSTEAEFDPEHHKRLVTEFEAVGTQST